MLLSQKVRHPVQAPNLRSRVKTCTWFASTTFGVDVDSFPGCLGASPGVPTRRPSLAKLPLIKLNRACKFLPYQWVGFRTVACKSLHTTPFPATMGS